MATIDYLRALNDISASQRGLLTTAQAEVAGVPRGVLSRLERAGNLERLAKGVYRMGGAPSTREEDVLAAWLSLDPNRVPGSRPNGEGRVVASGATAAWLQGLGEIGPWPYEFCCAERRQTQRPGLVLHKRAYDDVDVTIAAGIPVTVPARTVLDLAAGDEDLSLVGNVLRDALPGLSPKDRGRLVEGLAEIGRRRGRRAELAQLVAIIKE